MVRILILDDHPDMQDVLNRMTTSLGHECFVASTIDRVLEVLVHEKQEIDIIVADVGLPGETLMPLLHYLRINHASLRVLLISGTDKNTLIRQGKILDHLMFLQKPFTVEEYATALHKLLEA